VIKPLCYLSALLSLVLLGLTAARAGGEDQSVIPYPVHRETLPNGLKVLMIPMPSDGLVSYWSVVRTGSRDEVEPGVTGFAHFFEHMMFRGSENYPPGMFDKIVASMGADANAFTSSDITAYHFSLTREDLPKAIALEADRFQRLKYDEPAFRTEAGAVYGEYRKNRTSPYSVLFEAIQDAAFDKHTYKHTTIGFEADIKAMPEKYQYSLTFFKRFYRPENVVLLITGDFDRAATMAEIKKQYGGWQQGYVAPKVELEPEQKAARRIVVPFEGRTLPLLSLNWKGERLIATDRQMMAGYLLGQLAFGETSKLYKQLVLEQQRVEQMFADFGFDRDPGLWSVILQAKDAADLEALEAEIWKTVTEFQTTPVSADQLADAISRTRYGFLSGLETPDDVASAMARFIALTGDVKVLDEMYATLSKLTPQDIQAAAKRYLTKERVTAATLHAQAEPLPAQKPAAASPTPALANSPILMPVKEDPNVTIKLWFQTGAQHDPAGKEGLASLTAEMIDSAGTERLPYDEILARLYPLAAGYSFSVDKEQAVMTGSVHRDLLEKFYPLFTEALLSPGFRQEDFERIKSQRLSLLEKTLRFSSDEELGKAALAGRVFAGTRYAHIAPGTVSGLKAITLDDVRRFYREQLVRGGVTVALSGSYPADLLERLARDLTRLPEGKPTPVAAPQPAAIRGRQVLLVKKPGNATAISLGYPVGVKRGTSEFYALWLANSWLGEHRNSVSHLYKVIRETRGMNYGDYSYIEAFPNGGSRNMPPTGVGRRAQLFEIWIRPVPEDRAVFALRAALREYDKLIKNGLTKEQFESHRAFLRKYVLQFATTSSDKLGYAVDDRFYGLESPGHLATFRKTMESLTLEEVNAAIRKHFQSANLVIAMVTADPDAIKQSLVSGKPTPISYGEIKKPKEVLQEDKQIEKYPLGIRAEDVTIIPVEKMFE
jgi:zinc protease